MFKKLRNAVIAAYLIDFGYKYWVRPAIIKAKKKALYKKARKINDLRDRTVMYAVFED